MSTWLIVLIILVVAALLWAYFTAQRLNRLHIRTDAARRSLEAALNRRAAVLSALEPGAGKVADRAEAIDLTYGNFRERAAAERAVTEAVAALGAEPPARIVDANVRVELALRFYNEAVADTRALRLRPAVKYTRLRGTAALPEFFEL